MGGWVGSVVNSHCTNSHLLNCWSSCLQDSYGWPPLGKILCSGGWVVKVFTVRILIFITVGLAVSRTLKGGHPWGRFCVLVGGW